MEQCEVVRVDTVVTAEILNWAYILGPTGPQGEAGNAMYIYDGLLNASVVDVQVAQITIPTGRTLQAKDILISSYEGSVGAMAQVVSIADGVATVDFIGQISAGGSGGTTLNKYNYTLGDGTTTIEDFTSVANILFNAKGRVCVSMNCTVGGRTGGYTVCNFAVHPNFSDILIGTAIIAMAGLNRFYNWRFNLQDLGGGVYKFNANYYVSIDYSAKTILDGGNVGSEIQPKMVSVSYWNDREIT